MSQESRSDKSDKNGASVVHEPVSPPAEPDIVKDLSTIELTLRLLIRTAKGHRLDGLAYLIDAGRRAAEKEIDARGGADKLEDQSAAELRIERSSE